MPILTAHSGTAVVRVVQGSAAAAKLARARALKALTECFMVNSIDYSSGTCEDWQDPEEELTNKKRREEGPLHWSGRRAIHIRAPDDPGGGRDGWRTCPRRWPQLCLSLSYDPRGSYAEIEQKQKGTE